MKHIRVECKYSLKCEKCSTTFSRKSDLKSQAHIKSDHENSVNKLKCHLLLKEDSEDLQEREGGKFYKYEQQ